MSTQNFLFQLVTSQQISHIHLTLGSLFLFPSLGGWGGGRSFRLRASLCGRRHLCTHISAHRYQFFLLAASSKFCPPAIATQSGSFSHPGPAPEWSRTPRTAGPRGHLHLGGCRSSDCPYSVWAPPCCGVITCFG